MGNVSALEKGSGKAEKITITNDKGRLSKEDIEKMVADAEKFKGEDDKQKERISAKNGLESFIFNLKSSLDNEEIKSKLSSEELAGAQSALDDALKWMDANQLAEKEEFEDKQKGLEKVAASSNRDQPVTAMVEPGQPLRRWIKIDLF